MAIGNGGEFDRELHVALGVAQSIGIGLGDREWSARFEYGDADSMGRVRARLESIEGELYGSPALEADAMRALVERARTGSPNTSSAASAVAVKAELVDELLEALSQAAGRRRLEAAAAPRDYGYAGDFGHLAMVLAEALSSIAGLEE